MSRKPIKRLRGWGGGKKELDSGIRNLVLDLARHGYKTYSSCEGGRGHDYCNAWIGFYEDLSKEDIDEIKDIVEFHTSIPFIVDNHGILFKGPLKELPLELDYEDLTPEEEYRWLSGIEDTRRNADESLEDWEKRIGRRKE